MIIYLVPFEQVGDFYLKSRISTYIDDFKFEFTPTDETTGWEMYEEQSLGISLYVENNIIESISCNEECLYGGRNIIGMNIDEFMNFYGIKPNEEVDKLYVSEDEMQDVYEFDDIGLQVWCSDNIIVTVIASYIE